MKNNFETRLTIETEKHAVVGICKYATNNSINKYSKEMSYLIKCIFAALLLFGFIFSSMAQTTLTGVVVDSDHQSVLAFVNIGIKKKNIGTSSLDDGTFSIKIPKQNENDTLTLSMVGYSELNIPIQSILTTHQKTFQLMEKMSSSNITSVNLHINQSRKDSGTFRINFYKYAGNRPSERIIETSIIQTKQIQEGWLKFDLTPYKIYLKGSFVVAIEFIPNKRTSHPIYYEVKLGGSAKSFVRTSSQGEWSVPPHHYRLFVTALVSDKKKKFNQDELEEKESLPVTTLFSENVKDSFSIFVSLPKDYAKKKNQNFPVIYLLDANVYFDIIADAMNEIHSKAILVGIGYKDFVMMDSLRNRDYTFPKASPQDSFPISGGAFNFLFFIKNEIIPYIDKAYRTETNNRTLMGHSLGAYFTLFVLMQEILNTDHTFKNYVAASPSLHYGNKFLMDQWKQSVVYDNSIQQNLWLTCGAKEDIEDSTGTEGIDNFNSFVQILDSSKYKNVAVKVEIYPAFGHMETAVPTFVKSLKEME